MITKRKLDKKIDTLRTDMAAEFVKRDKQISGLREAGSETWERLDSRTKDLEEFCATTRDMVRVIIKHLHIPHQTIYRLLKEVDAELHTDKYSDLPATKDLGGELEKEADLFTAAEERKEQGAVHNNTRKYYRDKKRPQVRSWARRFNIPVKIFCYGMKMCGIEGVAVTPRDTTEMQYKRLTEQEANQVFRFLCEKVGELK